MGSNCICCDSINWSTIPYIKEFSYQRCNECGYYIQDRLLTSSHEEYFELEQEKYYGDESLVFQEEPNIIEKEIIKERVKVITTFLKVNSSIIEAGPGGGGVLRELVALGHDITAVEHSEFLANKLRTFSANVIVSEFEEINTHEFRGKYDAFCSFHVIEHVNDVLQHLMKANELVKSGGFAFIATPNADSWQNIFPYTLSPNFDTAHFQLFSKKALQHALQKTGWELIFVKTPEYTFSWLRVFTKILRRIRKKDESLTAGEYAQKFSFSKRIIYHTFKVLSFPLRWFQQKKKRGNELYIVARKIKGNI